MHSRTLALLLVGCIGISACAHIQPQGSSDATETVKVGVILPLTGFIAEYGIAHKNGLEMAVDDAGTTTIDFVFEDGHYDAKTSISAYRKLVDAERVDFVVAWGTAPAAAVLPLSKQDNIPLVAVGAFTPIHPVSPLAIHSYNLAVDFSAEQWKYLRSHGIKDVGIVKTELEYFNSLLEGLKNVKQERETVTVVDTFQLGEQDFRAAILKLKNEQYDAVGVYLASGQIAEFYTQAKESGLEMPLTFGTENFESGAEISAAQGLMDGAVFAAYNVPDSFKTAYQRQFGNASQITAAAHSYDVTSILLSYVQSAARDDILSSLQSVKDFRGTLGTYTYTEKNGEAYFSIPIRMKQIDQGKVRTLP